MSRTVKKCCVPGCTNKQANRHSIPANKDVSVIWLQRINNPKLTQEDTLLTSYRICDIHFEETCKYPNGRLMKLSLPTLYLPSYQKGVDDIFWVREQRPSFSTPKKLKESIAALSSTATTCTGTSPIQEIQQPVKVYTRKRLFQALEEEPCDGVMPTLETTSLEDDTDNTSTLHNEFIIKEETSMQSFPNKPNILDCSSNVSRSTSPNTYLESLDILEEIKTQNPNMEVKYVDVKIENEDDIVKIVDEPDNEMDDNTSDDLVGVISSLEAKYNYLYKQNHILTKIGVFPNLEWNGEYTISTESNHLIDLTDIQNICRVCLQKSDNLISIIEQMMFENKNIANMTILEALQSIICDKVDIADNLPHQICLQCQNHLKSFVMFKHTFNRATSILHNFANGTFENTNKQSVPASTMEDHDYSKNDSLRDEKCCTMELETSEKDTNTDDLSVLSKNSEDLWKLRSPTRRKIFRHDKFKCGKCHRSFKKKSYLLSHMLVHSKTFLFRCKYCEEGFSKKEQLVEHVCHQYGVYKCKLCFKVFSNSRTRQLHSHKIHFNRNKNPGYCPICNLTFKNINYHKASKHPKEKGLCTVCGLYVTNIYMHMLKHRNVSSTKPYQCPICSKSFSYRTNLKQHLTIHNGLKALHMM